MSTSPTRPLLDHLILLVLSLPHATKHFTSLGFTVRPGGTHADGLTENALIVLPDGVYIEVIAFTAHTSPEQRAGHWWGKLKPDNWADWSLTPPAGQSAADIVKTAKETIAKQGGEEHWDAPRAGGRRTPDGQELKWEVAFPDPATTGRRGRLPFICADMTSREWRVPPADRDTHTNGAQRVTQLVLLAYPGKVKLYARGLSALLDEDTSCKPSDTLRTFTIATPTGGIVDVVIKEPQGEEEVAALTEHGEGFYEVSIRIDGRSGGLESSVGRIRFV